MEKLLNKINFLRLKKTIYKAGAKVSPSITA